jgi:hypothetical protein
MFRGKAELDDPENNARVATFTEMCEHDGAAKAKVVLRSPITISGTDRLAIYSTIKDEEVIVVTAKDGASTEIHEFGGESSLGCLPDATGVSLTKSPGGDLGTLLVVLGKGTIHKEHH